MNVKKPRKPKSKAARVLTSLLVTLVFGLVYFYLALPALNFQDSDFYFFLVLLCLVFMVCTLFNSGFQIDPNGGVREYFRFVKSQCLPAGVIILLVLAVGLVGSLISLPIFRAADYRDLLTVQDGNFAQAPLWTGTPPNTWATARWAPSATW